MMADDRTPRRVRNCVNGVHSASRGHPCPVSSRSRQHRFRCANSVTGEITATVDRSKAFVWRPYSRGASEIRGGLNRGCPGSWRVMRDRAESASRQGLGQQEQGHKENREQGQHYSQSDSDPWQRSTGSSALLHSAEADSADDDGRDTCQHPKSEDEERQNETANSENDRRDSHRVARSMHHGGQSGTN